MYVCIFWLSSPEHNLIEGSDLLFLVFCLSLITFHSTLLLFTVTIYPTLTALTVSQRLSSPH